ncbi:BatD family protein [Vibrio vulnificus]|uniref:BatD family protein n=1 Tax=Vibrio vulnificus TaxID=672 RepID=UPI0015930415|nr:BatD family protein [Vibrio vulnificus]EGQ8175096.1 protein BatD [Vibrio vulnificus]ELA3111338.1 BatD family protein [Vibrio vulnificus]ELB7530817.1 BatD family protein [Vibrio vulnificus]ELK2279031.1 BatD family protein [Vibrio vulnificus]ELK8589999.1 BatD family protein [Vibrio vulnificus]
MNRMTPFFILLSTLLFTPFLAAKSLVASVNKTKVSKNEVIQLTVRADYSLDANDIDFSALSQDFFTSSPRFVNSSNYINGQSSKLSEWTLSIAPNRAGIVTIPAFSVDGESTAPIPLEVSVDQHEPNVSDIIQYSMQLDTSTLYPQQSTPLKVEIRILADPRRLENPRITPPSIQGVEIEPKGQTRQFQRVEQGLQITVIEQNYQLTANQPGLFELKGPLLRGSYIYGDSLTGSTKILTLDGKPQSQSIKVKAIPNNAAQPWLPAQQLSLVQQWHQDGGENNTVEQGSSITREITLTAKGLNENQLPTLKFDYPASVRVYDEKPAFKTLDNGTTQMTLKQVLILTETGDLTLPSLQLAWWNTVSDQQETAALEGRQLKVKPGSAQVFTLPEQPAQASETNHRPDSTHQESNQNATIWFYLTWTFASLWILTLIAALYCYKHRGTSADKPQNTTSNNALESMQALQKAITDKDAVKIEALVRQWMKTTTVSQPVKQAIESELKAMHQATYSLTPSPWQAEHLLTLIKQSRSASTDKASFDMPKL